MTLRLMQVFVPGRHDPAIEPLLEGRDVLGRWRDPETDRVLVQLLIPAEETEPLMDALEARLGGAEGFRILLSSVEAALPRQEPEPSPEEPAPVEEAPPSSIGRVSREELYQDLYAGVQADRFYLALAALSALVAAVGLLRDDVAIIIGAMVIAPLLGPNVALSLGVALGDRSLVRRALRTNLVGSGVVFGVALGAGLLVTVDPRIPEIDARSHVEFGQLLLALAAGGAGTLAYTRGLPAAVIGVMVAVALVPPLVAAGMLLGEGEWAPAGRALLLTGANVTGVNLTGTATFVLQGVRPYRWSEAHRARRATRFALAAWVTALVALVAIVVGTGLAR